MDPKRILLIWAERIVELERIGHGRVVLAFHEHRLDNCSNLGRLRDTPIAIDIDCCWLKASRSCRGGEEKNEKRESQLHGVINLLLVRLHNKSPEIILRNFLFHTILRNSLRLVSGLLKLWVNPGTKLHFSTSITQFLCLFLLSNEADLTNAMINNEITDVVGT